MKGYFVISLDFELFWGVRDVFSMNHYGKNILGVHKVIPLLLETAHKHDVKLTFAIVGFCFHKNKQQLLEYIPTPKPGYEDANLSPYNGYIEKMGDNEEVRLLHFAPNLIQRITEYPEMEIGTHTYSHYYCVDKGQNAEEFKADIEMAVEVAKENEISIQSLVFPRNQANEEYLKICKEIGIKCYRGNENNWLHKAGQSNAYSTAGRLKELVVRAIRLTDAFISITGHNCHDLKKDDNKPVNIPSSRFLRSYSRRMKMLDSLKLHRITSDMTYAAKHGKVYHLWFHPHNFGENIEENFFFFNKILRHYQNLNAKYGFESITMTNLAERIITDER